MTSNSGTIFQIGTESLGKIIHPFKHVRNIENKLNNNQEFHRSFCESLMHAKILLSSKAPDSLLELCEEAKYSALMSVSSSLEVENRLTELAQQIINDAMEDLSFEDTIETTRKYLAIRNQICEQGE